MFDFNYIEGQFRIVYDETEQLITPLQCGSEVLIKHRASDLCLTMTKNMTDYPFHFSLQ